ncbi:Ran-specific GTPase-activating protein 30, partial [Coemansia sp. RSA 1813]
MEDLFSKLALQTVTLVGKAAFGAAGSMALRRVAAYANRVPQPLGRQAEVDRLRAQFEAKLRIITPAIDLVDIISARGHSTMASVLQLTYALRNDIMAFSAKLEKLDQMVVRAIGDSKQASSSDSSLVVMFRRVSVGQPNTEGASAGEQNDLAALNDSIVENLKTLLMNIEDAVPLLNLALTTSGAHLGSSLPPGISPSRLMQASALLSRSSTWLSMKNQKDHGSTDVMVGDPFVLRLYSLFVGSVRPKSKSDFTWKEEYAKCHVALWRCTDSSSDPEDAFEPGEYVYELRIIEDLDDGRYHDDEAQEAPGSPKSKKIDDWVATMNRRNDETGKNIRTGRIICIPLDRVNSLHYTSAGSLLNIEDSSSPVLVVSSSQDVSSTNPANDSSAKQCHSEDVDKIDAEKESPAEQSQQTMHWYALEVMVDDNHDNDDGTSSVASSDNEEDAARFSQNDEDDGSTSGDSSKESDTESVKESKSDDDDDDDEVNKAEKHASANEESENASDQELQEIQNATKDEGDTSAPYHEPLLSDNSNSDTELLAAEEYLRPVEFLANEWSRCTLSLLEYTIRLASVEMREQLSHLEVPDEKLRLYLLGGAPGDPYAAHGTPGGATHLAQATPYNKMTPAA